MVHQIEQTISSQEVAEMIGKEHKNVLADVRRYIKQFAELNIQPGDFFEESIYKDANNQTRPCYKITKKGCEFIAHKLTGVKGTAFTARYIKRFHEMEDMLIKQPEQPTTPWYFREFKGERIVLFRDFETLTGVKLQGNYTSYKRYNHLEAGRDWNGYGWRCNKEEFKEKYGFDFGDENVMCYLYERGFYKALQMAREEQGLVGNKVKELLTTINANDTEPAVHKEIKTIQIKADGNNIIISL